MSTDDIQNHELTRKEHDELQQLFDGELDPGSPEFLETGLLESELAQAHLAQFGALADLLRDEMGEEAPHVQELDSAALFADIERGIEAEKASEANPRLRLIEGGRQRRAIVTTVVALAAAAALFFMLRPSGPFGGDAVGDPLARGDHPVMDDPREVLVEQSDHDVVIIEAPPGSEVEDVDFGANTGTVFSVEGAEGESLAVVWIDEGNPKGGF